MWTRKELKDRAKAGLKRNYWKSVVYALILSLILGAGAASGRGGNDTVSLSEALSGMSTRDIAIAMAGLVSISAVGLLLGVVIHAIIYNPAQVGIANFAMEAVEGTASWQAIGVGYKPSFFANVWGLLRRDVVVFLWSLLLVIPGIVMGYAYSQVEYILAENPGMTGKEAMAKSKAMMKGNKWNVFVLDMSFLGWQILSVCTYGIVGVFYVRPYKMLTKAALYKELAKNA